MPHPTKGLSEAGFGTMTHRLVQSFTSDHPGTPDRWNRLVDDVDVKRFNDELAAAYAPNTHSYSGAVTWDMPIHQDGATPDAFVLQLTAIGKSMNR